MRQANNKQCRVQQVERENVPTRILNRAGRSFVGCSWPEVAEIGNRRSEEQGTEIGRQPNGEGARASAAAMGRKVERSGVLSVRHIPDEKVRSILISPLPTSLLPLRLSFSNLPRHQVHSLLF